MLSGSNRRNYNILTFTNAIAAISGGFSAPFLLLYFYEFSGSASVFATAVAIQGIFMAIVSYYAGKLSDKSGRKPLLIWSSVALGVLIIFYAFVQQIWQLYLLQALAGIITAVAGIAEKIFLADITQKESRGADMGRYFMIIGILASISTIIGGFFVGKIPFQVAFMALGVIFVLDTAPLLFLTEKAPEERDMKTVKKSKG